MHYVVTDQSDFKKMISNKDSYEYICKICGKKVYISRFGGLKRASIHEDMMCRECKIKSDPNYKYKKKISRKKYEESMKNHYGSDWKKICTKKMHDWYNDLSKEEKQKRNKERESRNLKRFGYTTNLITPEQLKKTKQIMRNKYNTDYYMKTKEFREKSKRTKLKKYGDSHYTNYKKRSKTFEDKFGNNNPFLTKNFKEKTKIFMQNKYNSDYYVQTDEFKNKSKDTKSELYGNPNYNNRDKYIKTMLSMYGDPNYNNREQANQTKSELYGSLCLTHKYNYYGIFFDSSWELAVWIYCIDNGINISKNSNIFDYSYNNEKHYYEPDFMINGELVEIKGDQYWSKDNTNKMIFPYNRLHHNSTTLTKEEKEYYNGLYEAKHKCGISNGVVFWKSSECKKYIDYCNTYYPNWKELYRKDNPYNPSYWCYYINNTNNTNYIPNYYNNSNYNKGKGISPYDINNKDSYTIYGKGISIYDIKLERSCI